jgi:hypothetical protein
MDYTFEYLDKQEKDKNEMTEAIYKVKDLNVNLNID